MLLPLGDTPNPPGTPSVNYLLIAVNVVVFLLISLPLTATRPDLSDPLLDEYLRTVGAHSPLSARMLIEQLSAYDLFVFRYGFRPASPSATTLFASLFLHSGWMHLLGNMLFLWIFGDNVEHRFGSIRYLLAYLAAGVAATLFFALFVPNSPVPLIGASGAISGVLGCYYFWFPRNRVKTFIFLFPFIMNTYLVPARWVLGFYLLIDNLLPFLVNGVSGGGVAHGAHIGGFGAGLLMAFVMDRLPDGAWKVHRTSHQRRPRATGDPGVRSTNSPADRIMQAMAAGDIQGATELYQQISGPQERARLASQSLLAVGQAFLDRRDYDQALSLFRRFITERPNDPALDRAYLGAGRALMHKPRCATSAYHYFLSALDLARSPETMEEARRYLRGIEQPGRAVD